VVKFVKLVTTQNNPSLKAKYFYISYFIKYTHHLMTTSSRNLLILFLIIIWGLYTVFVYKGCYDTLCSSCGGGTEEEAILIAPSAEESPFDLSFSWDVDTPSVKQAFASVSDSLSGETTEAKILTITGLYFKGEKAPDGFEDLGLARAYEIRNRLFSDLDDSQVRLRSSMFPSVPEGAREGYFQGARFGHIQPINPYPIAFLWKNPKPFTSDGLDAKLAEIMAEDSGSNILEITGLYFEDETDEGQNIGLERARRIREQFFADLPDDRIQLRARADRSVATAKDGYFEAAVFEWVSTEETVSGTVEELADRIIIRFPYNSVEKDYDPAVDEYLDKLAGRVKETGESVQLTGHTDNSGAPDYNMDLGMRRAEQIKNILLQKGVPANLVSTESKGETQAVAPNTTEQGRHENRRVEVRLIKQ
jgi:outer membrane protein OmpA-like peptidoglycan-associated protein